MKKHLELKSEHVPISLENVAQVLTEHKSLLNNFTVVDRLIKCT